MALKSKKMDYLPNPSMITDPETRRFCEDLVMMLQKSQKDAHDDLQDHENRIIVLEP